jgi:hypothetical protein
MKKLIILLFLLTLSVGLIAQRAGTTTGVPFINGVGVKALTMTSADTVGYATTVYWNFDFGIQHKLAFWAVAVKMNPTGVGTPHVHVTVWGSNDGTNFVNTGATTVKYGGGADSLFQMVDVTTGVLWRYLKVQFAGVAGTANKGELVKALSIKVAEK